MGYETHTLQNRVKISLTQDVLCRSLEMSFDSTGGPRMCAVQTLELCFSFNLYRVKQHILIYRLLL